MNCFNETITVHCLQQICQFGKPTECSGQGGNIAAGIIVTALVAAAISAMVHLVMHIWFYRPRMQGQQGRMCAKKKTADDVHEYETIFEEEKKVAANVFQEKDVSTTKFTKNMAYSAATIKNTKK